jgi:flagellin
MSLNILNNIAALYAQNNLNSTQSMLQSTLQQLSSGSRINSGADDPSGLAVSNGMAANVAALTQSAKNATSGIGLLQTADGALSQVTSLLDQATTLATEASGGTLTNAQLNTANQEYQNILTQIANIGAHTNFNSNQAFTNSAVNMAVGDGTTTGTSIYSNIVGVLTKSSVGTTGATPIASVVSTPPIVAVPNTPGQYTLTAGASTDTLAGNLSFNIGSGSQQNICVVAGSSLATVSGQLTTAGLSNTVSNNVIHITGPTAGADAAANTVNFSGTSLSFTPAASNLAAGSYGTIPGTPGQPASVSLTLAGDSWDTRNGNSTADEFSGTIVLNQAGQTSKTITIAPGSLTGPVGSVGSVEYQIAQQLQGSAYALANDTGSWSDPTFNFTGADTASPLTIDASSTFHNTTTLTATATASAGMADTPPVPTQNTYTLGALGSSTDTFGSGTGNANTLDINGTNFSIAGMTATTAKLAINGNGTFQSAGISASVSSDGTTLTILGNADGSSLSVLGYNSGSLALTDQSQYGYPATTNVTGSAVGTIANWSLGSGTGMQVSGANSTDEFGGTFTLSQGPSVSQTITIAPGSDGASVESQINTQLHADGNVIFEVTSGEGSNDPLYNFCTSYNGSPLTVTLGTFADTSTPDATIIPNINYEYLGYPATQGTFVLGALNSSSDTFGSGTGNANMLDINGTNISIAGMSATAAEQAINNNTTMQGDGISASVNGAGTQLTILGDTNGDPLTVQGYNGGALALTDQAPLIIPSGTIAQIAAPTGSPAAGGTAVITMSSSTDTLSGPLKVVVNGNTASLTVAAHTTGLELQNQINLDASFQAASLSAVYNSSNATITITGPTGAGNSLDTTGTSLTDTTASGNLAGAGANFTTAGVSVLNASTAAAVLTTITSAVADVAYQRGSLGADINELTSASSVASSESVNLASAQNSITATDYGQAASNLSKYQILSQTGISALAQANTVQQEVLKLLQ